MTPNTALPIASAATTDAVSLAGATNDLAQDDRVSAAEAARILGLSLVALYRAARMGRVPCWHIGRRVRFSRRALEAFIAAGGTRATAA